MTEVSSHQPGVPTATVKKFLFKRDAHHAAPRPAALPIPHETQFGERDVAQITIDLTVEPEGDFSRLVFGLFKNPDKDNNLIPEGDDSGRSWSSNLDPGSYTFQVDIEAPIGTELTVKVTCGAFSKSFTFKIPGQPGSIVDWVKNFPFTIAADGSVS